MGYRYFDICKDTDLSVEIKVNKKGDPVSDKIEIYETMDGEVLGSAYVPEESKDWQWISLKTGLKPGKRALFIKYSGEGSISIRKIRFI